MRWNPLRGFHPTKAVRDISTSGDSWTSQGGTAEGDSTFRAGTMHFREDEHRAVESTAWVPPYGSVEDRGMMVALHQWIDDMSNYRRATAPGATWFFTVNLLERRGNDLLVREIDRLRACVQTERLRRPFSILAWVVLPEHMHWLWRLPTEDADFATRWKRIKTDFSLGLPPSERRSPIRIKRGERGIWQRRYWEHQIRDADDLQRHVDYIHFNPVKHGWVSRAVDWPHSSFAHFLARGVYAPDWAAASDISVVGDA